MTGRRAGSAASAGRGSVRTLMGRTWKAGSSSVRSGGTLRGNPEVRWQDVGGLDLSGMALSIAAVAPRWAAEARLRRNCDQAQPPRLVTISTTARLLQCGRALLRR